MATTITSTYSGEFSGKYISAALLSSPTLDKGLIEIKPNVKYKDVIKKVSATSVIANAGCDFSDGSTITLTERVLQPEEFMVNIELCKKDFVSDWEAIEMGYSYLNQNLPPKFSDFIIGHVAGLVAEKTEQNIWGGVNANAGEFDGFTVLMAADSDVNDAANDSATEFTSSNIVSLLENVVDALPSAVYGKEDLKIYVPKAAWQAYIRHLGGYAANGVGGSGVDNRGALWYNQGNALSFDGIEVVLASGMPSDHIVAGQKSNLFFGTGLLSDHNEVKLLDMADLDGSQNVRVIMRFSAGVQYGIGGDLALLTLA